MEWPRQCPTSGQMAISFNMGNLTPMVLMGMPPPPTSLVFLVTNLNTLTIYFKKEKTIERKLFPTFALDVTLTLLKSY